MYSRDDSAINEENRPIKCESSPPTPRSLRLERGSGSHNTSAEDTPRSVSPCRATYGLIQRLACTCEEKMFGDFILLWLLMTSLLTVYIHLPYVSLIFCKKLNIGHTFFVIFIYQLRDLEVSFIQGQSHWERSEVIIVSMEFVIVGRIVSQCQIHRDSLQSRLLGYVKRNRIWSAFIRALY